MAYISANSSLLLRALIATVLVACPAMAQQKTNTRPEAIIQQLEAARLANGIDMQNGTPWHLKATYTLYDDAGKATDTGTVEQWWASADQQRISVQGQTNNYDDYIRNNSVEETGTIAADNFRLESALSEISTPVLEWEIPYPIYREQDTALKTLQLRCLMLGSNHGFVHAGTCLAGDTPIVRINIEEHNQVLFDQISSFHGRSVAHFVRVLNEHALTAELHVQTLEDWNPVDSSILTPAANAKLHPKTVVTLSAGVAAGILAYKEPPRYPSAAKEARVQGTVVVHAVIGKDGRPKDLKIVSGPPQLQDSSLEAIKQWRYRPYRLGGNPVEVETIVNVIYTLGS